MGMTMKRERHKRKETFSVLLISNTGRRNRQFHISLFWSRLLIFLLILLLAAAGVMGWMIYRLLPGYGTQESLRVQLDSQQQMVTQLETEKEQLNQEKLTLEQENEALRQTALAEMNETVKEGAEEEPAADTSIPRGYPSSGTSVVISSYSEEQPYLSINLHEEGNVVATGNGTVILVTEDDTYPAIVEVEHDKGYRTRYMCLQSVDVQATEGAQVETGDILFKITADDTQLDYQILFEGEAIDPLTVIEAKG